jgi:hypothetical protein
MSTKIAIGSFLSYEKAKIALSDLKDSGFPMSHVSVLAQDTHHELTRANTSLFLRDMDSLNIQSSIAIADVRPVIVAGSTATTIAIAMSENFIGTTTGSLMSGLMGLGISPDRSQVYRDRVFQGDYLVMLESEESDIDLAESIFRNRGIRGWYRHSLVDESVDSIPICIYPSYV